MAEILLKVGDGAGYEDGDVLCAFNRRRTRCVHAERACHLDHAGKTKDGLRPQNCLARWLREHTHQYRFERVSRTEIERVTIATGERELFGPESIDVPLFVQRRLKHGNHAIFGLAGREFWFGGTVTSTHDRLDLVWQKITEQTSRLETEEEFTLWPMGRLDIRHHLAVRVVDFSEQEATAFTSPQYDLDAEGNPLTDSQGEPIVIAKRNIKIDWRAHLLDDLQETARNVLDPDYPVGRDVTIDLNKSRHQSKTQPEQASPEKLWNKAEQRAGRRLT